MSALKESKVLHILVYVFIGGLKNKAFQNSLSSLSKIVFQDSLHVSLILAPPHQIKRKN